MLRTTQSTSLSDEGATRMLSQLKCQFNVVQPSSELKGYSLLVLPDGVEVDEALAERLREYLKQGGRLLASGTSGLTSDGSRQLLPELGFQPVGLSPYTTTYFRFEPIFGEGAPESDHVMYERGVRALPGERAQVVAKLSEPYFERAWDHFSSHNQTPPERLTSYAAALLNGSTGYIAYPVFEAFARHGNVPFRWLVKALLERLLPDPILRLENAPTGLETSVMRQGERVIVHLLYYAAERRARDLDLVEDIVPLHNLALSLRLGKQPQNVYLAPERQPLAFEYHSGRVHLNLPRLEGHAMIVVE
jgi:hypothetical protein